MEKRNPGQLDGDETKKTEPACSGALMPAAASVALSEVPHTLPVPMSCDAAIITTILQRLLRWHPRADQQEAALDKVSELFRHAPRFLKNRMGIGLKMLSDGLDGGRSDPQSVLFPADWLPRNGDKVVSAPLKVCSLQGVSHKNEVATKASRTRLPVEGSWFKRGGHEGVSHKEGGSVIDHQKLTCRVEPQIPSIILKYFFDQEGQGVQV